MSTLILVCHDSSLIDYVKSAIAEVPISIPIIVCSQNEVKLMEVKPDHAVAKLAIAEHNHSVKLADLIRHPEFDLNKLSIPENSKPDPKPYHKFISSRINNRKKRN